jgi:hypothetical protein
MLKSIQTFFSDIWRFLSPADTIVYQKTGVQGRVTGTRQVMCPTLTEVLTYWEVLWETGIFEVLPTHTFTWSPTLRSYIKN